MTIKEYMAKLRETGERFTGRGGNNLVSLLADTVSIWSNDACRGYCLQAARDIGLDDAATKELLRALSRTFDDLTTDEAEQIYYRGR